MSIVNKKEILAYKKINKIVKKKVNFNLLQKLCTRCKEEIFQDLKIYMVLTIKWHFDYLAKTRTNPNKLNHSLNFWYNTFNIFLSLAKEGWIVKKIEKNKNINVWKNTRKAFNFMWPKNTYKEKYNNSRILAELRLKQIINQISTKKNFFKNKIILDSGCGPGRYIDAMLNYAPKKIIGIDSGQLIIKECKKRFKKHKNAVFFNHRFDKLKFKNESIDFVISAGTLHHTKTSLKYLIEDHARVIKKGGHFFIFIAGSGGQELSMWKFCRKVMENININNSFNLLNKKISPMRMQGFLDHSYGEYKITKRRFLEKILRKNFSKIQKVVGINGADVTKETFNDDPFFTKRFGSGNLRYLCQK